MNKRTDIDFGKHILYETHYTNPITGHNLDVWELKIPGTMWGRVIFINSCDTLTISGDYGRFSFSREFHPSKDGRVSDEYWLERMRRGNHLIYDEYDSEATEKEIQKLIDTGLKEYGYEGEKLEELKRQLTDLLNYVDDKIAYQYHAFRGDIDLEYEMIPYCKQQNVQLDICFDAFDWICKMIRENGEI